MEPALAVTLLWLLFGGTHIGLATGPVRAALVARLDERGFTVLFSAVAAAGHQDRKLLGLRGRPYADYVAVPSLLPFAAILAGRQPLVWRELPLGGLAVGVVAALALRAVHGGLFDHGGAWVIGTTLGGAALASFQSLRHIRRARARSHRGTSAE